MLCQKEYIVTAVQSQGRILTERSQRNSSTHGDVRIPYYKNPGNVWNVVNPCRALDGFRENFSSLETVLSSPFSFFAGRFPKRRQQ